MNAQTNDELRKQIPFISKPNLFVLTRGIASLEIQEQIEIIKKVKSFNHFTPANDPYGEHDFGSFTYDGKTIFWKVDDYAGNEGYNLVLTVLFADEY